MIPRIEKLFDIHVILPVVFNYEWNFEYLFEQLKMHGISVFEEPPEVHSKTTLNNTYHHFIIFIHSYVQKLFLNY